ncbi:DUF4838 domain-containing protein [Paenibacillus eucommiae]|uniref:DUF4838 domain-containing protein n=1 Tax=Paenibacillus eucommiae TaxID=1355755 RepID=A0ABS4IST5_9BACL|nr:DUF4838 domain-containing protein [Paenibacillus eucommiae]MBP1989936.1 hypothetical protein [Paenibacillus eucommiae]
MNVNRDQLVMSIQIVVPYSGAELFTELWSEEEREIDFDSDHGAAGRCTTAFAAMELKRHLSRSLPAIPVRFVEQRSGNGCYIALHIADSLRLDEAFTLERIGEGVVVTGVGRAGVLYGAYELLRLQGWRWYALGDAGAIMPQQGSFLILPEGKWERKASMDMGRGFDFEYVSMESETFFLWMARNRLNVTAYRSSTAAFCRKLGMIFKVGGHIFEAILDPDRLLSSGITVWEQHPHWYGLPENGIRIKEEALRIQFCVSQPDLIEFLGAELVRRLQRDWKEADRVDLWGFDTWGHSCMCTACQNLGSSADRLLHFVSGLRGIINHALALGDIGHPIRLIICGYEGTDTLDGPQYPVPDNVAEAGDLVVYYPINRCYEHDLDAGSCSANSRYHGALQSWCDLKSTLPVIMGEYYNVSKFEDLPLLFTSRMAHDIPAYWRMGVKGITYMHVPLVNWGMRTLTQLLYAQLSWDAETDTDRFLQEYFVNWYGPHAVTMSEAYESIEQAWGYIADWRSWKKDSVLSLLLAWDGAKPVQPLAVGDHFQHQAANAVQAGRMSLDLLDQALQLILTALADDKAALASQALATWKVAINPVDARAQSLAELRFELRLGEDRRLLLYGIDTLKLQVEFVVYYDALYKGDESLVNVSWQRIEQTAERMDAYFLPIGYEQPGAGLESKAALTRSQLRELIRRCRTWRHLQLGSKQHT